MKKNAIALSIIITLNAPVFTYAGTFWGRLVGSILKNKIEKDIKVIKWNDEALKEDYLQEVHELINERKKTLSDKQLREIKTFLDQTTGKFGTEHKDRNKKLAAIKQRLKNKNIQSKDVKDLRDYLKDIPKVYEAQFTIEHKLNTIMVVPIPATMPVSSPILVPAF